MNINQLRQFAAVARYKSMTRAAQELYMTQQALSKTLKLMQNEMGGELFVSRGQGLQLTDLGSKLLAIAESLMPRYDSCMEMITQLIEQNKNRVSVCFENGFGKYAIPAELMLDGTVSTQMAADGAGCIREVEEGRAEVGVCSPPEALRDGMRYFPLVREPLMLLMRREHPLAGEKSLRVGQLRDYPHIMPALHSAEMNRYISRCIDEGFFPRFVIESRDFGFMVRALLTEDLLLPCPSFAVEERMSDLVLLPLEGEKLFTEIGVVVRRERCSGKTEQFVERLREFYKTRG